MPEDCIFCRIVQGKVPCSKLFEDEEFLAFLDIAPINKGHALVIPKEHYETIFDVPEETLSGLAKACKRVAGALLEGLEAEGVNLIQSSGKAANQEVLHIHIHVVPRFEGDGQRFGFQKQSYLEGEMKALAERLARHF